MSEAGGREALQRLGLALPFLLKRSSLAQADLAQELGESRIPIKIPYKGPRMFRFFLNPKGFGTGRIQAPPVQQCPPCRVPAVLCPLGLLGQRETVLFLPCGHLSPATVRVPG